MAEDAVSNVGSKVTKAGLCLFLAAWFLPVCRLPEGPHWLPGWLAVRVAWNALTGDNINAVDLWRARVLGASVFTNIVMIFAAFVPSARRPSLMFGIALLACVALNAGWILLFKDVERPTYHLGYYCWLGSFALTGIGLLLPRGRVG